MTDLLIWVADTLDMRGDVDAAYGIIYLTALAAFIALAWGLGKAGEGDAD